MLFRSEKGVHVGTKQDLPKALFDKIAREGARTVPGREHGGNCDVCDIVSNSMSM